MAEEIAARPIVEERARKAYTEQQRRSERQRKREQAAWYRDPDAPTPQIAPDAVG